MKRKPSPAAIGAFVLGAIILTLVGVVVFGSGTFFQRTTRIVMYFDESVAGLDIGAPVEFSGVRVGRVAEMKLVYDEANDQFLIPVYVDLVQGVVHAHSQELVREMDHGRLVELGLRGKLESSSFVTGKLKISLSFLPRSEARLVGWDRSIPEVPTVPGTLESLIRTLQSLPLTNIVNDAHRAVRGIAGIIEDPKTEEAVVSLSEAGASLASLAQKLDAEAGPVSGQLRETLQSIQEVAAALEEDVSVIADSVGEAAEAAAAALETAGRAVVSIEESVDPASPLRFEVLKLLRELQDTARALRTFLDTVERDPSSLIGGKSKQ